MAPKIHPGIPSNLVCTLTFDFSEQRADCRAPVLYLGTGHLDLGSVLLTMLLTDSCGQGQGRSMGAGMPQ